MLKIRLQRVGKRNDPHFRVVVQEHTRATDATALEILGHYHPQEQPSTFVVDKDRVRFWLDRGAQMSPTVSRFWAFASGELKEPPKAKHLKKETPATETPTKEPAATATA